MKRCCFCTFTLCSAMMLTSVAPARALALSAAEQHLADRYSMLTACETLYQRHNQPRKAERAGQEAKQVLKTASRADSVSLLQVLAYAEHSDNALRGQHGLKRCNRELKK
ncbi:hypothetical protein KUV89_06890 [Marinobacter hydrocarbonoclasticus]|nr:hypothetical protein [Marinobacter nauticus]